MKIIRKIIKFILEIIFFILPIIIFIGGYKLGHPAIGAIFGFIVFLLFLEHKFGDDKFNKDYWDDGKYYDVHWALKNLHDKDDDK